MSTSLRQLSWYGLDFPTDLEPAAVLDVIRGLASRSRHGWLNRIRPVVFEVEHSGGRYQWRLGVNEHDAPVLIRSLRLHLPAVRVAQVHYSTPGLTRGVEVRLRSSQRAVRTDVVEQIATAILVACSGIGVDEAVIVQWVIGPWLPRSPVPSSWDQSGPGWPWRLLNDEPNLDTEAAGAPRAKQRDHVFGSLAASPFELRVGPGEQQLLQRVFGALQLVREPGVGFVRRLTPGSWVPRRLADHRVPSLEWPCALNAAELTGLLAWPFGGPVLNGITYRSGRPLPAVRRTLVPTEVVAVLDSTRVGDQLRPIAEATYPGQHGLLVLRPNDALQHLHVLGPTGSGKSHLLANLVLADIAAGRGTVVIEPKGDLVNDILERIPAHRAQDIVVLDASDLVAPLGLNPLASATGARRELVVDQLLATLHGLWRDSWGPRTHDILHAGLLTLAGQPGASLIGLPLLFTNNAYRRRLVAVAVRSDPWGLASFWAWFDSLSPESRAQVLAPVMNKLRSFILRPSLRAILGQSAPRFDIRQVFTEHKVLLVNLAKGSLGPEASALLGSVVVSQLWQQTLERSRIPAERRQPVMVAIDEFQDYLHLPSDLADVLAQARGLGVGLTLAHQHLGQLTPDIRDAVIANAQSRVVFRLPHRDARVVAEGHGELTPEDIAGLDRFEVYASLVADGTGTPYASGRTREFPVSNGGAGEIRAASRARWGVPAVETDAQLRALFHLSSINDVDDEFGTRRRTS